MVKLRGVYALDVRAYGFGVCAVSLVAASGSVFRGVVECHSWYGEEELPSVSGFVGVVVFGVVDDVVTHLSDEVGVHCATLWGDGLGCGRADHDVVPRCVVEVGKGWESVGAHVVCWGAGLVGVGGCRRWRGWVRGWGVRRGLGIGDELLDVVRSAGCYCDGNVWPSGGEAAWVPRVAVVVGVADAPLTADEIGIADSACGALAWKTSGAHRLVFA